MAFPKIFERPVGATPEVAYATVRAFLTQRGAKIKEEEPPIRIRAVHGSGAAMATSTGAKKIFEFYIRQAPNGAVVRVTMPLSKWHFDDGRMLEFDVGRTWAMFLEPLWWSFGYPPSHI